MSDIDLGHILVLLSNKDTVWYCTELCNDIQGICFDLKLKYINLPTIKQNYYQTPLLLIFLLFFYVGTIEVKLGIGASGGYKASKIVAVTMKEHYPILL